MLFTPGFSASAILLVEAAAQEQHCQGSGLATTFYLLEEVNTSSLIVVSSGRIVLESSREPRVLSRMKCK